MGVSLMSSAEGRLELGNSAVLCFAGGRGRDEAHACGLFFSQRLAELLIADFELCAELVNHSAGLCLIFVRLAALLLRRLQLSGHVCGGPLGGLEGGLEGRLALDGR